jgi:hypothetical protein
VKTTKNEEERTFKPGDLVKCVTDRGTYEVQDPPLSPDGSVRLFGGDSDRSGYRAWRNIRPADLLPEDRKDVLAKLKRQGGK